MLISFVKASACGNDFLIVETPNQPTANLAHLTRTLCDRKMGIGADGVEWLSPDAEADTCARLFNSDGSEAELSGNGTRCVAAYLCSKNLKEKIVVRTGAGLKTCTLTSHHDTQYEFEIAMGEPQIGGEVSVELASGRHVNGTQVSMGNPHFVSFLSEFPLGWQAHASEIGRQSQFKQGINVEWVVIEDKSNILVRFFERGVGETQSSGTGSCAAAVAAISAKKAVSPISVLAVGGTQIVRWDDQVFLRGPAQIICRGEFLA